MINIKYYLRKKKHLRNFVYIKLTLWSYNVIKNSYWKKIRKQRPWQTRNNEFSWTAHNMCLKNSFFDFESTKITVSIELQKEYNTLSKYLIPTGWPILFFLILTGWYDKNNLLILFIFWLKPLFREMWAWSNKNK